MSIKLTSKELVTEESIITEVAPAAPFISSFTVQGTDDLALDTAGGQTIVIKGKGFKPGLTVVVAGSTIGSVTLIDSTTITFTSEAKSSGTYNLFVINQDGGTAILTPGLIYSGLPTFTTSAGSLGTYTEVTTIDEVIVAEEESDTITYSIVSGSLPSGASLNSAGYITGTSPVEESSTTYTFTVEAVDEENQSSTREFSLTINTDVVTWSSPSEGTIDLVGDEEMTNVGLTATAASGYDVSYTANTLPNNVFLTGNTVYGTPNTEETVVTTFTATAANTNRTATRTVTWVVSMGDLYFNRTTLLLNANTTTWITDSSTNGFEITPAGDAKPSAFSPYNTVWSNYFDGSGDYIYAGANADLSLGSGDFTIECWIYPTSTSGCVASSRVIGGNSNLYWEISHGSGNLSFQSRTSGGTQYYAYGPSGSVSINNWHHIAVVRSSNIITVYVNGIAGTTTVNDGGNNLTEQYIGLSIFNYTGFVSYFTGYISNFRTIKGTALYTSNFTPSTTSLTTTSQGASSTQVELLTSQSNRFIDNSTNNFTITKVGDVIVSSFGPFTETDTVTGSGYFDGSGDYLSVPASSQFLPGVNTDFTFEAWVYLTATPGAQGAQIVGTGEYGTNSDWNISVNSSRVPVFYINVPPTGLSITSSTAINLFSWNHIALTRSGTGSNNLKMFLNGVNVGQTSTNITLDYTGNNLTLGADENGDEALLTGYISGLRLINGTGYSSISVPTAPLTPVANTSLLTLQNRTAHNNNTFLDESGNRFNITRSGNATQGSFSPFSSSGWSNYFDGNDSLTIPSSSPIILNTGSVPTFTIELWFFETGTGENLLDKGSQPGSSVPNYRLTAYSGTITLLWGAGNGSTFTAYSSSSNVYNKNEWTHLAVVSDAGNLTIYVNGVSKVTGTLASYSDNGKPLYIGSRYATDQFYVGYISNLRIIKGTALYGNNFTPSTTPLDPIANTSILACRSNRFEDEGPNRLTITINGDTRITPFSPFAPHAITPKSYGVYFDGNGDYLSVPDNDAVHFGSGSFTIEAWIYLTSHNTQGAQIVNKDYGNPSVYQPTWREFIFSIGYSGGVYNNLGLTLFNSSTNQGFTTTGITLNLNTWYHVAAVRNGNAISIYVNGVSYASGTTTIGTLNNSAYPLYIGVSGYSLGDTNQPLAYFPGHISNLRLVKGEALYTSNFTPNTTPLTAVANTSLLTCQSETFKDNSNNAFTISQVGNSTITNFNPFGETITQRLTYSPSTYGGSAYFDGSGDLIEVADNITLEPTNKDWCIEFWMYPTVTSDFYWLGKGDAATAAGSTFSCARSLFAFYIGGSSYTFTTNSKIITSQWNHIVWCRKGTDAALFINGERQSTTTGLTTSSLNNVSQALKIGGYTGSPTTGYLYNFNYTIGNSIYRPTDLRFAVPSTFKSVTSNNTLAINFTGGGISDATSKNVLETVGDVEVITESPYSLNQSVYFDGTGDFLTTTYTSVGSSSFCIEAWVNINDVINRANYLFLQQNSSVTSNAGLGIGIVTLTTGRIYFFWNVGTTQSGITTPNNTLTSGTWNHIACVRDGNTFTVYVNGVSVSTTTNSNAINTLSSSPTNRIGQYSFEGDTSIFKGYISNFRFVIGSPVYTTNFTLPTVPLTAISGTSLLTCHSNRFIDSSTNNFTITRNGDAKITSRGPFTETVPPRSLKFDGSGDYLTTSPNIINSNETGDFTIEGWLYNFGFSGSQYGRGFATFYPASSYASTRLMLRLDSASNKFNMYLVISSTTYFGISGTLSTNLCAPYSWTHFAFVRQFSSGTFKLYINGILDTTISGVTVALNNFDKIDIGRNQDGTVPDWNGLIKDLRVTKNVARYTSNFSVPTSTFRVR